MTERPASSSAREKHWNTIYRERDGRSLSWFQEEPTVSLELLDVLGVGAASSVVDVGGGESVLVDRLVARGFADVTVLDVSTAALAASRERVGHCSRVTWIVRDVLTWRPERRYDLWHDRAVLHFMTGTEIDDYRAVLERALAPNGSVILGTFALEGPASCSGLPVTRYDATGLAGVLGSAFEVIARRSERHRTPAGTTQDFTWLAARRPS